MTDIAKSGIFRTQASFNIDESYLIFKNKNSNKIDITLFVSCFNEEDYIQETVSLATEVFEQLGLKYEIIVVDDGSSDSSVSVVKNFINDNQSKVIKLIVNEVNKGLAQNYYDISYVGLGKYYRLMCGDNSETRDDLIKIFSLMGSADIIIPFHISHDGKSKYRKTVSAVYTRLLNTISGKKFSYYNGLQLHLRENVMRWHSHTKGFAFQAGTLLNIVDSGASFKEIGVSPIERRVGKSNALSTKNMLSVCHVILEVILQRLSKNIYKK